MHAGESLPGYGPRYKYSVKEKIYARGKIIVKNSRIKWRANISPAQLQFIF